MTYQVSIQDTALADFDRLAKRAADRLCWRFWGDADELIALARARFIMGFDLYPAGPLFEMDEEQLRREANEEGADMIVYTVRELLREDVEK